MEFPHAEREGYYATCPAPAMKPGIAEYPLKIKDIVEMLPLPVAKKRGPCKKRPS
jgi:hypothetical protein